MSKSKSVYQSEFIELSLKSGGYERRERTPLRTTVSSLYTGCLILSSFFLLIIAVGVIHFLKFFFFFEDKRYTIV